MKSNEQKKTCAKKILLLLFLTIEIEERIFYILKSNITKILRL